MSLFSRVFNKPAQVSLVREGQTFFLRFFYDNHAATYAEVREKWQELGALDRFIDDFRQNSAAIKLSAVDSLKAVMRELRNQYASQNKLNFYISADVEAALMGETAPDGFAVKYIREGDSLRRCLPDGTVELEEGWMRLKNRYWRFEKLSEIQLAGFRRNVIERQSLIAFLKGDVKEYMDAGVPIHAEISYQDDPAVELLITSFGATSMEFQPIWHINYKDIDESFILTDYVLANNVVYPGLLPSQLQTVIPNLNHSSRLEGCDAARFLDERYTAWRSHMIGDLTAFEAVHRWIEPPYRWVLIARAKELRGIGRAYAHPYASIGGEEFSVEQMQDMLKQPYVRIASGWVRNRDLLSLRMDENAIMEDGTALKPIRLDADLLLHGGGRKIDTPFSAMRLDGANWCDQGNKHSCANNHLDFLLHWGVNGGLTGGYEAMAAYGLPMILRFRMAHREATVLVLGSEADCAGLREASPFFGNALSGEHANLLSYSEYMTQSVEALNARWDLVCLIEPDVELARASSAMVQAMASLKAACKIGFFWNAPSENMEWMSLASTILGYRGKQELVDLLVRDSRKPKPLPEPYRFTNAAITYKQKPTAEKKEDIRGTEAIKTRVSPAQDSGAVIILRGAQGQAIPVPTQPERLNTYNEIMASYRRPKEDFFKEAHKYATYEGVATTHVPFTCYWPKYSDMNAEQRKWYFHMRNQLHKGVFPDTDLSYLFVYIYELINQIGIETPKQGLDKLMEIWRHYGNRYPQLTHYLGDWVFDYTRINQLDYPVEQLLMQVPELSDHGLNVALTEASEQQTPLKLPVWALEKLSQYRITSSKFYQKGNQTLVNDMLPGAVAAVDGALREKNGKGILETYAALKLRAESVNAFAGALTESQQIYHVKYRNYTSGLKLQGFLKNLVRYIENDLRTYSKYSAKLQGIELAEPIKACVDAYVKASLAKSETAAPAKEVPRIVLDLSSVDRLRAESNQVRDALIASVGEEQPMSEPSEERLVQRPADAPEGMLTDLAPVQRILKRLSGEQRVVLEMMREADWGTDVGQIHVKLPQALPEVLIDEINVIAMGQLGCALIEREADSLVVAEDYRDELEYLMPKQHRDSLWSIAEEDLDDDWRAFFEQIHERVTLDALAALLEGPEAFAAYARERNDMPDLLLDGINEIASDTIGDLVADADGVYEDYLPEIKKHLIKE